MCRTFGSEDAAAGKAAAKAELRRRMELSEVRTLRLSHSRTALGPQQQPVAAQWQNQHMMR